MKTLTRIAASVLCALLLCGAVTGAVAEQGWNLSVRYTANGDQAAALCRDLNLQVDDVNAVGRAIAEFVSGLSITGSLGASEISLAVNSGSTPLANGAMRFADGRYQAATSMMPGTIVDLTDELTGTAQAAGQYTALTAAAAAFAEAHAEEIAQDINTWKGSLTSTEDYGIFTGDAYSGGVIRSTTTFTDRDLGLLGVMILARMDSLAQDAAAAGMDWNQVRSALTNSLVSLGVENAGRYTVSSVFNESERPVGLSLTAYQRGVQVATLSVGFDENMNVTAAVVSFGVQNQVYILSWRGTATREGVSSLTANGEIQLWQDPTRQGYRAASADSANLLGTLLVNSFSFTGGEKASVSYDVTLALAGKKTFRETYSCTVGDTIRAESAIYYDRSQTALITAVTTLTQGETAAYAWPAAEPLSLSGNAEVLAQKLSAGQTVLVASLLAVLPMELRVVLLNSVGF